jgi:hemerythrin superfamily protein
MKYFSKPTIGEVPMPSTTTVSSAKKPAARRAATAKPATATKPDAIALLKDDHKKVKKLFKDFDKTKDKASDEDKEALVRQICMELTLHAQIEEEVFYPAVRKAIGDEPLLDEATVEHATAKDLIRQLESMSASDPLYDAKVTVLGEYIDHHVEEEQGEMFPKAKKAKLDMDALGKKLASRKRALLKELQQ